jgi:hypothetical protein
MQNVLQWKQAERGPPDQNPVSPDSLFLENPSILLVNGHPNTVV